MNYAIANADISPAGSGKTAIQVPSKGYYLIVEETSIYEARSLAMLEVTTKSERPAYEIVGLFENNVPVSEFEVYFDSPKTKEFSIELESVLLDELKNKPNENVCHCCMLL